ncbi:MAG: type II toxin-antitoxin system RelE/ParE family toxin [Deltaproteobacteria bacterium]|nr:type II toxin-antitoxin system RelE/ParE family toxin [Deltaproteobacteria bacterium]MBI3293283.1 type II toxin-antitoxin system RelE/ParE family toxin [Deltaproteobacteria bacterium]
MYTILFKKSAKKEYERLPHSVQSKILEALHLLSHHPYSELLQIKKLKGTDSVYRFRVGDYRVLYEVLNDRLVIVVIKIGHRSEVYR